MSEYDGRKPEPVYKTESELLEEAVDEREEMLHKIQRLEQRVEELENTPNVCGICNWLEREDCFNKRRDAERERDRYREDAKRYQFLRASRHFGGSQQSLVDRYLWRRAKLL